MFFASVLRLQAAWALAAILAMPARAEDGLLLQQVSARYGSITCLATNKNFRMDASELRVFLKPPFKRVDLYNLTNKTKFSCNVDDISKDVSTHDDLDKAVKAGGREEILLKGFDMLQNYKLSHYEIDHVYPHKAMQRCLDFWITKEKDFPQELDSACCKLSGIPEGYGFPVKMFFYQTKARRNGLARIETFKILETKKVTKQDFPATTFAQPQGCRPVADLMELMVGGDQ